MWWLLTGLMVGAALGFAVFFYFIVELELPGCLYCVDVAGHRMTLSVGRCDPYLRRVIATYRGIAFSFRSPTLGMVNTIARYRLDYIIREGLHENGIK